MRQLSCLQCPVRHLTCIADLAVADLEDFESCRVTGFYKPRQVVFHQGMPASGLYVLCHGTVQGQQITIDTQYRQIVLDTSRVRRRPSPRPRRRPP